MEQDKPLNVTDMKDLEKKVVDVEVYGDPGAWKLLGKASSRSQGWMKSTKAMNVGAGVLVQTETQFTRDGVMLSSQALVFVPGVKLVQVAENHYRITH